ncbi:Histone-lysine N-methyltransferase SUVR4 [Hordeum vulgare]|nr:Histone-lysine N-methyltransferase SUVR4 [Hordeum vulgare]
MLICASDARASIVNHDKNPDNGQHAVKDGVDPTVQKTHRASFVELDVASSTLGEVKRLTLKEARQLLSRSPRRRQRQSSSGGAEAAVGADGVVTAVEESCGRWRGRVNSMGSLNIVDIVVI